MQGQGQGLDLQGQGQGLDILGQEHDSWGLCRVGHGSIFADPIQSNPKIAGIKDNSYIRAYVPLSIVMTINIGYSAVVKSL